MQYIDIKSSIKLMFSCKQGFNIKIPNYFIIITALIFIFITIINNNFVTKILISTFIIASIILAISKYSYTKHDLLYFLNKITRIKSIAILSFFIFLYLMWSGLVIFSNPYQYGYNHGDAIFSAQTLFNLIDGFRPENSYYTFSNGLPPGIDPRYCAAYGYISIFALHQYWLPILLLSPLYAIHPQPPMHVYSIIIIVLILGVPGVYKAIRAAGGERWLALIAAMSYPMLPHVEMLLFFKGYFDVIALAVFPWIFTFLFERKWVGFHVALLSLALISIPYAYNAILIGIVVLLIFKEYKHGIYAIIIGLAIVQIDTAVYKEAVLFYKGTNIPSFAKSFVLNKSIGDLVSPIMFYIYYIMSLIQAGAFLPVLALMLCKDKDKKILGLLSILMLVLLIMLFRSYGWEFQRNPSIICTIYILIFVSFIELSRTSHFKLAGSNILLTILISSLASYILLGIGFHKPSPLASHILFGGNSTIIRSQSSKTTESALTKLLANIPQNESLAFVANDGVQAILANRQNVWHISREPKGVKFYLFWGDNLLPSEKVEYDNHFVKVSQNQRFRVIYTDPPNQITLFENLDSQPIPRKEKLLGWEILFGAIKRL